MLRTSHLRFLAALLVLALAGCATRVRVPPRVELGEWDTIGIVEFGGGADPKLASLATEQFVQMIHTAQPGARILELGPEGRLLAEFDSDELDFEVARALGERFHVDAIFTGALETSEVEPNLRLGEQLTSMRASANVHGRLAAKLLETRSGAVVWSRGARATSNVARVGVRAGGGIPSLRVGDANEAYAGLVPQLVDGLSHDFHPTWTKRP